MSGPVPPVRDRYHALRVKRLLPEAGDATSVAFEVPPSLSDAYAYEAGQFVTLRVHLGGDTLHRSYSMSSAPSVDADLQVTVKRVPGGVVSNWVNDDLREGDTVEVSLPTGTFLLAGGDGEVVAFAGGSGITPVFSLVKAVLHTTPRAVRLLFANRDRDAAIFGTDLDQLAAAHPGRLVVEHHQDAVDGLLEPARAAAFAGGPGSEVYICGPGGFMDVVQDGLQRAGVDPGRVHLERFTPLAPTAPGTAPAGGHAPAGINVTITCRGRTETVAQRGSATILQSARWAGLPAPSTCEAGHCATCMAEVLEGEVEMVVNDALTPDEVAEGLVLTCQAVPLADTHVVYDL